MPKQTAEWLKHNYGDQATAVVGCYHRALGPDSRDGGHILEDLRRVCLVYETSATMGKDGTIDPIRMAINEGRRQAYLHIVNVLQGTDWNAAYRHLAKSKSIPKDIVFTEERYRENVKNAQAQRQAQQAAAAAPGLAKAARDGAAAVKDMNSAEANGRVA